ncbi:phage integrase SAM-like domain-containing protein [Formosa sp. 4Alg 33]|uniref:phage integrase SAM-like domain-containing protein n=1 Tax=Formosa sp. 4Alg 33 TaxID=3382189 RepID=UPI003D9C6427
MKRLAFTRNVFLSAQVVKTRFLGDDSNNNTLLSLIDYHNRVMTSSLSHGTLENYYITQKYIKLFLLNMKAHDMNLSQLSYKFILIFKIY